MPDASRRLARNVRALDQALGGRLTLPAQGTGPVIVEPGTPAAVSLRDEQGHPKLFHSRRNPLAEAERSVEEAVNGRRSGLAIVLGAGLGYVPEVIARRFPEMRVIVIEPEPAFARLMLSRIDWREQITSGRLLMLVAPEYTGVTEAWRMIGDEMPVPLEHPVLARLRPSAIEDGRAVMRRILFDARANAEARGRLEASYLVNTLRNLAVLAREADAAVLTSRFDGVPAVVVAAGPSLDRQMSELRAVQERALIVAVDTAVHPLLSGGVRPHVVVAVDPTDANSAHLAHVPPTLGAWLVSECSLAPQAFPPFVGRTFCFRVAAHEPWPWAQRHGLDAGTLRAWGSVLTTAFDLALSMQCDPIMFAGADLAYTHGRPYCRGTIFEHEWAQDAARGTALQDVWNRWVRTHSTVDEIGVDGAPVVTSPRLVAFRNWIVETAARHPLRRFINTTAFGILHGACLEQRSLGQVVGGRAAPVHRSAIADLWASSAHATTRVPLARRAIAALQSGQDPETLERWQSIVTGGAVDLQRVLSTAAEQLAAHGEVEPPAAAPADMPDARSPEHLARLRRFMGSGAPRDEGDEPLTDEPSPADATGHEAATALHSLVPRLPDRLPAIHPGDATRIFPLTAWTRWSRPTARGWTRFEGALGALLSASRVARARTVDPLVAIRETPWVDDRQESSSHVRGTLLAAAAVLESMMVAHACAREGRTAIGGVAACSTLIQGGGFGRLLDDLLFNVTRQLTGDDRDGPDALACCLRLSTGAGTAVTSVRTRLRPRYLMRAFTGLIVERGSPPSTVAPTAATIEDVGAAWRLEMQPGDAGAESSARFLAASRAVAPRVMEPVLPPCLFAHVLNGHEAMLGAVHTHESYAVDQEGRVRVCSAWPRPIIGEVPWGDRHGTLAWNNADGDSYVLLRRSASGRAEIHPVPFRPSSPLVLPDRTVLWASYFGGLWSWHPERGARLEADAPPALGIRERPGGGVRLDPAIKHATGVTVRQLHHDAYTWQPGHRRLTTVPAGARGVSWCACSADGWRAETYPHADVVALTTPDGREFELACYFPVSAAWAGSSLVVTSTTGGHVLFFPDVRGLIR